MIYLDSCLLTYLVEQHVRWGASIARLVEEEARFDFAISPLVKCECLVGPLRSGNAILRQDYVDVLTGSLCSICPNLFICGPRSFAPISA